MFEHSDHSSAKHRLGTASNLADFLFWVNLITRLATDPHLDIFNQRQCKTHSVRVTAVKDRTRRVRDQVPVISNTRYGRPRSAGDSRSGDSQSCGCSPQPTGTVNILTESRRSHLGR